MEEPGIKVGIYSGYTISLHFVSEYFIKNIGLSLFGNYLLSIDNSSIVIKDTGCNIVFSSEEIEIVPTNKKNDIFEIEDVIIGVDFHWERKEKQRFRGGISIIKEEEKLTIINKITVEQYIESVISSEMNANASIDFLKSHAIISRSWLLSRLNNVRKEEVKKGMMDSTERRIKWYGREEHINFDVCADDHCQRYQGITRVSTEQVRKAVHETKGLVLKYADEICDARFSKCCGGISEDFENVWEDKEVPYLKAVVDKVDSDCIYEKDFEEWIRIYPDAFCNTNDKHLLFQVLNDYDIETKDFYRWTVKYTQKELADIVRRRSGIDFGDILSINPLSRGRSGRIIELELKGSKHTMTIGKELEIRKVLSESHLFSSAFVVDYFNYTDNVPQNFIIRGAGWGHGVGLCQIGAAVMADKGYSFENILMHYFKGAQIEKIY